MNFTEVLGYGWSFPFKGKSIVLGEDPEEQRSMTYSTWPGTQRTKKGEKKAKVTC